MKNVSLPFPIRTAQLWSPLSLVMDLPLHSVMNNTINERCDFKVFGGALNGDFVIHFKMEIPEPVERLFHLSTTVLAAAARSIKVLRLAAKALSLKEKGEDSPTSQGGAVLNICLQNSASWVDRAVRSFFPRSCA